jgi:hypothetical protein
MSCAVLDPAHYENEHDGADRRASSAEESAPTSRALRAGLIAVAAVLVVWAVVEQSAIGAGAALFVVLLMAIGYVSSRAILSSSSSDFYDDGRRWLA